MEHIARQGKGNLVSCPADPTNARQRWMVMATGPHKWHCSGTGHSPGKGGHPWTDAVLG